MTAYFGCKLTGIDKPLVFELTTTIRSLQVSFHIPIQLVTHKRKLERVCFVFNICISFFFVVFCCSSTNFGLGVLFLQMFFRCKK